MFDIDKKSKHEKKSDVKTFKICTSLLKEGEYKDDDWNNLDSEFSFRKFHKYCQQKHFITEIA